jgi:hypothetical protein
MGGNVACMGEMRNAYKMLVRNNEGRKPLRIPNTCIRMDLGDIVGRCELDISGSV